MGKLSKKGQDSERTLSDMTAPAAIPRPSPSHALASREAVVLTGGGPALQSDWQL